MELLYTNENGDLMVDRELEAAGSRGTEVIKASDFIPMPEGATLTSLPHRVPVGVNARGRAEASMRGGWPVAALLPQGFTRTLLPA